LGHLSFEKPFARLLFPRGQWRREEYRNIARDIAVFLEAFASDRQFILCKERVPWRLQHHGFE